MKKRVLQLVAVAVFCTAFVPGARAACGISATPKMRLRAALPEMKSSQAHTAQASDPVSIVGLWRVTFVSDGEVVDEGFDMWHSDGTEVLNDTPAPASGNVCLGVWTATGPLTFSLKHPSWTFDDAGNLTGTSVIREQVTLSADGNSFKGPVTVDVFDLSGNQILHLDGEIMAERITVD
jgi:hypothetical protein